MAASDDVLTRFQRVVSAYARRPVVVTMGEGRASWAGQGFVEPTSVLPGFDAAAATHHMVLDPALADAPPLTVEYLAAMFGVWHGANPYPYPSRSGMSVIRRIWQTTGDMPLPGTPRQCYSQCAWDRQTRTLSPYQLTAEMAEWGDAHETRVWLPSWRGRLEVQRHELDIWPAG